ncbi:MAG: MmcQ/YjbR family DNA-binding protein [Rhizobiaceae bacterium]
MASAQDVARLASSLPEVEAKSHFDTPDFRVRNKIFASLKNDQIAVVKLTPEQQDVMCAAEPKVFVALANSWGRQGWTQILLEKADEAVLLAGLQTAWRNVAPKRLGGA